MSERYTRPDWRLVIVILALAGCASEPNPLTPYVGKDVQTIVGRLGYPTSSREMLGHKIYTWNTGSPNGFYCVLDVAIDSSGHIKTINTEGNNGGCDALDERLQSLAAAMVMSKLSKIDAAVEQVDWAIRFFLDNQAYIPAITLAGAAEEILGRAVQGDPSYKVLKEGLAEMLGEDGKGIGEK